MKLTQDELFSILKNEHFLRVYSIIRIINMIKLHLHIICENSLNICLLQLKHYSIVRIINKIKLHLHIIGENCLNIGLSQLKHYNIIRIINKIRLHIHNSCEKSLNNGLLPLEHYIRLTFNNFPFRRKCPSTNKLYTYT